MKTIKTLLEKAEKFNLYSAENMPIVYKSDQNLNGNVWSYSEKISAVIEKHSLPSDILTKFEHSLLFECRKQYKYNSNEVELYYIEHNYTMFLTPGGNLAMLMRNNKGKWYLYPYYSYFSKWQKISSYIREEEIKKAYRKLSRMYHPDANINNPNKAQAEEKFKEITESEVKSAREFFIQSYYKNVTHKEWTQCLVSSSRK